MRDDCPIVLLLVALACACGCGIIVGIACGEQAYRKEAVVRGAARWEVDSSGDAKFVWLNEPKPECMDDQ